LLGGSGLLSGAARVAFLGAGHDVTVLSRGERALGPAPRLTLVRADRRDEGSLAEALAGARYDFTADFLAYDAAAVTRLLSVRGFSPGRIVLISSGQVYLVGAAPRPPFREADGDGPLSPEPAPGTRDHREWCYGVGKRAAEAALRFGAGARGIPALALRLPVVQGEADGGNSRRLWAWIERMRDGGPVLLPEGGAQTVRFVHAADVAAALVALAGRAGWPAQAALNLAQPDECTLRAFLDRVARLVGAPDRFVPVSAEALAAAGLADSCAPYWGRWCSRPDPTAALALGLATRTVADYLPGVVRAHVEHPPEGSHPGYARRAEELALAARRVR
jgi:nucleoside-diphosphate-sugar epimerase